MPALEQWTDWKVKCALSLCDQESQSMLRAFAHSRYRHYAAKIAGFSAMHDVASLTPAPDQAWHWFETYLRLHNTRAGKCYKDWLFARYSDEGAPNLDAIQGGATLLMRDVVRERARREFSLQHMVSLEAPLKGGSGTAVPSLEDLLADPDGCDAAETVARRELESLAGSEAHGALATMSHRERVALLARELGVSLARAEATVAAGCRKSHLNNAYHTALTGVAGYVRARYPRETPQTLATLASLVFTHVRQLVIEWGKLENRCAQLFTISSGNNRDLYVPDHGGKGIHVKKA